MLRANLDDIHFAAHVFSNMKLCFSELQDFAVITVSLWARFAKCVHRVLCKEKWDKKSDWSFWNSDRSSIMRQIKNIKHQNIQWRTLCTYDPSNIHHIPQQSSKPKTMVLEKDDQTPRQFLPNYCDQIINNSSDRGQSELRFNWLTRSKSASLTVHRFYDGMVFGAFTADTIPETWPIDRRSTIQPLSGS